MRLLALMALFPTAAMALTEDECLALHPEITSPAEMVACTSGGDDAEQRLAEAEAALMAALPEGENAEAFAKAFGPAQAAWRAWREAECDWQAAGYPGTGGSSFRIQCEADLARARAAELLTWVEAWKP